MAERLSQRPPPVQNSSRRRVRRRFHGELGDDQLIHHARSAPDLLRPTDMLRLQTVAGNRAVSNQVARMTGERLMRSVSSPGLVMRTPVIQREDLPNEDEELKNVGNEQQNDPPQEQLPQQEQPPQQEQGEQVQQPPQEEQIDPALAQGANALKGAVTGLDSLLLEKNFDKWPQKMDDKLRIREYRPGVDAWESLVDATRNLIQQEKTQPVVKAPKSLLRSFQSRDRANKRSQSAGNAYDRWMGVANKVRKSGVAKALFKGIVNNRLKANDQNLKEKLKTSGDKTDRSEKAFTEYHKTIKEQIGQSTAGQQYKSSANEIVRIMKTGKADIENTDNLHIALSALSEIRVDPRVQAKR